MVALNSTEALRRMPFFRAFICYGAGILFGRLVEMPSSLLAITDAGVLLLSLVMFLMTAFWRRLNQTLFPLFLYLSLFVLGISSILRPLSTHQKIAFERSGLETCIGLIADEPSIREKVIRFPVALDQGQSGDRHYPISGKVMLSVARGNEAQSFRYGDKIAFKNTLQPIPPAFNPQQFDYKRYCANKNMYYQGYVKTQDYQLIGRERGELLVGLALKLRHTLKDKFAKFVTDQEALSVCAALIFGHRSDFSNETLQVFSETGTIHVLSVSGMHVGIVFYLLNLICRFLDKIRYGKVFRFTFIMLAIWSYVVLTGMAPSILRAGLMISFLLFADWGERKYASLNSLFASAFLLLIFDPFLIFDVGFQLSYMAVFGLFTLYPLLNKLVRPRYWFPRVALQLIWVSLSAQLFTAPFALYYFQQFPTYFLVGNLFIALPSTLLMYLGILLSFSPFAFLNAYIGLGLVYLCKFMLEGLYFVQKLPLSVISGIQMSVFEMILFALLLALFVTSWRMKSKSMLFSATLCMLLFSAASAYYSLARWSFKGIKVYNVQRDLAIAFIDNGKVSLISTFDSLNHPRLKMLVWPDLAMYTKIDHVGFQQINRVAGRNYTINSGFGKLVIVNRYPHLPALDSADWIVLRNLRTMDTLDLSAIRPRRSIIFDGFNTDTVISQLRKRAGSADVEHYVLKDNFAYVWEKPD
ncbi:ComEC/Rec2 family competence protein [Sphingobacterium deserti]|uniref:ComEC/Rec2-related protein n=1 Tax=Sphingobacterium deserti TaxID=1229276 RepID=A0A0B8TB71_9SPHI|nr:ComEC/Rec2 family competence protein [Sphingobacterium deserti]KGE15395.1 ComEC/Rec2-related protein [Sphingobacterium deserti]